MNTAFTLLFTVGATILASGACKATLDREYGRTSVAVPADVHPWRGGYVVGNGKMYGVSGLDFSLTRDWKSDWAEPGPMSQIVWVVGPNYGNATPHLFVDA